MRVSTNSTSAKRATLLLPCCIACLGPLGCSDGRLPTFPVSGRVVFSDGSPVHTGTIEFRSREHAVQARGTIDHDGNFRLTTYKENDGAVAGTHDCVVTQLVVMEGATDFQPSLKGVVHTRFGSYATSGLRCEVISQDKNFFTVEVDGYVRPSSSGQPSSGHHQHRPQDHSRGAKQGTPKP
jgi:hypothetical protein